MLQIARSSSVRVRRRSTAPTATQPSSIRSRRLFRLALAELAALWLIVLTGAAVRLTDSGLGCRHWPGCEEGHPLPAKDGHAFIEFGNRLFGGVTIALALVVWLASRRTPVHRLALAIFLGTLLQAPIGLLAVASDLRWPIVMLHLLLSIALLGAATVLVLEARAALVGRLEPLVPRDLRRLGAVFVSACFLLIVSGSFATAAGPHSGGGKADEIDRFARLEPVVYAHATVVGVFLCTFLFSLGYLAARRERRQRLFGVGVAVLAVLLVQMALGELQWRTHLPWGLVLLHVLLAATVWIGVVALATLFWRPNVDLADR
jgi:cytochrome c oxidase assembly protein subunit 15